MKGFFSFFLEIQSPSNISIDRPTETPWILRPEDWKGQVQPT
jgi:hypothetical protein